MNPNHADRRGAGRQRAEARGLPWHWLLGAAALLLAGLGAWTLWGPMPPARRLPPIKEITRLSDLANASDLQALQYRHVYLRGRFMGEAVVLAGRDMAGRRGFYILAPFVERSRSFDPTAENGQYVLVQRGWVPAGTRLVPGELRLMHGRHDVLIEGRLALPSLGDPAKAQGETGLVRQNLSLPAYAKEIGVPLLPMVLLEEPGAEWPDEALRRDFFRRRWPQLYPRDRYIAPMGWGLLAAATVLAALAAGAAPRRR